MHPIKNHGHSLRIVKTTKFRNQSDGVIGFGQHLPRSIDPHSAKHFPGRRLKVFLKAALQGSASYS